jgi:hypothetical protein
MNSRKESTLRPALFLSGTLMVAQLIPILGINFGTIN